jgi:hypothetical protein
VVVLVEDLVVVSRWPPEPFFATTVLPPLVLRATFKLANVGRTS